MFDKHFSVQTEKAAKAQAKGTEKAAKVQAKSGERIANKQMKLSEKQAKREIVREKKLNQEGVYKKIGPFTIKTYIIMVVILIVGIMMLVDKIKGGGAELSENGNAQQEVISDDQ